MVLSACLAAGLAPLPAQAQWPDALRADQDADGIDELGVGVDDLPPVVEQLEAIGDRGVVVVAPRRETRRGRACSMAKTHMTFSKSRYSSSVISSLHAT